MSTAALNKLLEYILSLSLSDKSKDWLAERIIESKSKTKETKHDAQLFSMFGAWNNDPEMDTIEHSIHTGRVSGKTRRIISLEE